MVFIAQDGFRAFPAPRKARNNPGRLSAQQANEVYMPAVTLILPDPRRTA